MKHEQAEVPSEDSVFKALADDGRRRLLDSLYQRDGQTLTELCAVLPMTRFGVMKHLQILEDAGLVATRKVGREKLHFLNPVPIQLAYDRWVSKYAQPWTQSLTALKAALESETEEDHMSQMPQLTQTDHANAKPSHVFQVFIRTTPEKLWQALTDGTITPQYYFGTVVKSTWQVNAPYQYLTTDGVALVEGEVIESIPPRKLVTTFMPRYVGDGAPEVKSVVIWEIEPMGATCKLTLTHNDLPATHPATASILDGWTRILSGLKTLLETGEPLPLDPQ
jgi:DNA-binding transcriptional ArsR family regulator/uncharacterized protein YndB with AHSA1/START domain